MRMIKVKLSCGCFEVVAYAGKARFADLEPVDQENLRHAAIARHKCPEKKTAKAPPTSPEPQRP